MVGLFIHQVITESSGSRLQHLAAFGTRSPGQYLAAVVDGEGIYTSNNYGSSWTKSSASVEDWLSITSSSSGQYLAAVVYDGGIYTSSNCHPRPQQSNHHHNHHLNHPCNHPLCLRLNHQVNHLLFLHF